VSFKLKEDVDSNISNDTFGFIAQDIYKKGFCNLVKLVEAKENPYLIETTDEDGFVSPAGIKLTVAYEQIIPILTGGLNNVYKENEELTTSVTDLENKNKELNNKIENLESKLEDMQKSIDMLLSRLQ
jgi:peptidoglycan hydrolase CwlO-like protein